MEIRDFPCSHNSGSGSISYEMAEKHKLSFPSAYMEASSMSQMALIKKGETKSSFCLLPFCTSLEAEALGASVIYSDDISVPRITEYAYSSLDEILNLADIDFTRGRIAQVLKACEILSAAKERVSLEVSGPITILSNLVDMRLIMKSWRKDRETLFKVFDKLSRNIIAFSWAGLKAGATSICYADPTGSYQILGPKFSEELAKAVVLPSLVQIEEKLSDGQILHICPKTSYVLVAYGLAKWTDLNLGKENISYDQATSLALGKVKIIGENCVKNKNYKLKNGIIKSLELVQL